jgi:hypothetical protein
MTHSRIAALVLALAALATGSVHAKQESIAGTWTFSVEHIGLKLVLAQTKSTVTGTLDWPHGDPVKLTGTSDGENFDIHIDAAGVRKMDGTLTGTLKAHFDEFDDAHKIIRTRNQEMPWTAVRGLHDIVHFPR